ncbi:anti-sigma regulatory factor [Streptomyces indicus]|uniref:Serine/threonine-protein kinase RsbT n=1 Tax=Streptomyces indicus TaxID=417292 RepID=A0A1G8UMY7_9ACTN|nr:anti-sigma regulatory factor [Streptomyces indicus]SDJ55202.1 serine/threonine-protein kinase RsbT [Streptomyces indicus]
MTLYDEEFSARRRLTLRGHASAPGGTRTAQPVHATHAVRSEQDLLSVRHAVRAATVEAGFALVDQTRIVTAASELARNAYVHGGGGSLTIEVLGHGPRRGVRLTVRDQGPGIPDVDKALTDGWTTGSGLGHGLGGARRLMHEFTIDTAVDRGTTVTAIRWNDR